MGVKQKFEHIEDMSLSTPKGEQTRRLLEKKGIKSPELKNMVKIDGKTWVSKKTKKINNYGNKTNNVK